MHEGPYGPVVAQAGSEVNGVVKGGAGVSVSWVVGEDIEEVEGFEGMVPEAFDDLVDELWGPMETGAVEGLG